MVAVFVGVMATLILLVGGMFLFDYQTATVPPPGAAVIAPPTVLLDVHGDEIQRLDAGKTGTTDASRDGGAHLATVHARAHRHRDGVATSSVALAHPEQPLPLGIGVRGRRSAALLTGGQ